MTLKLVSLAEEYLADHFPTFPVLPGVLMLEAMVQAGRRLIADQFAIDEPMVLGKVRAMKYGRIVKPGCTLRVEVSLVKRQDDAFDLKGEGVVIETGAPADQAPTTAVSGRFSLRPARVPTPEFVLTNSAQ